MKLSKFVRINTNILLEYIYDENNIIGEPYSVVYNSDILVNSFVSSLPETNNYFSKKTILLNNVPTEVDYTNQLVKLNTSQGQYTRLQTGQLTFVQKKDFGTSIPIRYDKIRVHLPVNYIFENYKGIYLRVYTLDYNEEKWIDLSNYFFNISDINQSDEMQYGITFIQGEMPWGKYLEIQFPAPGKVSEQRRNGLARENTINYNLTDGIGLSDKSPVFVDIGFIESFEISNGTVFYKVLAANNTSFPSNPEYEKIGVRIEKSSNGDFFLVYPILNGNIGQFNRWIEERIRQGERYYIDYELSTIEKTSKTSTQRVVVTEDFIEEVEWRPILKTTTTTASLDVTFKLVNMVDGTTIERFASYGMLWGEVSNYSKFLTKIDLSKAMRKDVIKVKGLLAPNLDSNTPLSTRTNLKVNPKPFTVYSNLYRINVGNSDLDFELKLYLGQRKSTIILNPFTTVIKFKIIELNSSGIIIPFDLNKYSEIILAFRSDDKTIQIEQYFDSNSNNLELGEIVFKINSDKYEDIKKIYTKSFTDFYIIGITDVRNIIYTGSFLPWDFQNNINSLNDRFTVVPSLPKPIRNINIIEENKIEDIRQVINEGENKPTSVNTTTLPKPEIKPFNENLENNTPAPIIKEIETLWTPYWEAMNVFFVKSYDWKYSLNPGYVKPGDLRSFALSLRKIGIISDVLINIQTGELEEVTRRELDRILGYFKIFNFPTDDLEILNFIKSNKQDLDNYLLSSKSKEESLVIKSSNVPPNITVYSKYKEKSRKEELILQNQTLTEPLPTILLPPVPIIPPITLSATASVVTPPPSQFNQYINTITGGTGRLTKKSIS